MAKVMTAKEAIAAYFYDGATVTFGGFANGLMHPEEIMTALEEAAAYFNICALGLFFIFGYNALSAILRGVGNSRIPLYCVIVSVSVNVGLDLLFVAFFRWGVEGAAAATVIAQGLAFLTALIFALRHRADLGLTPGCLRPAREMVGRILRLGTPTAVQWTIASVSWLVVVALINQYGVSVSAGNGVSNKIRDFCQLFVTAMCTGAGTMCAQCLGAQLYDRAEQVMKTCMRITLIMAGVIIAVAELFAPRFAAIFTPDPQVQQWAVLNLRIEILGQIFYAVFMVYHALAIGAGHSTFAMLSSFANCIVFRVVLSLLFNHLWGIYGLYAACAVAPSISVPLGWLYTRSGVWRRSLAKTEK